MFNGYFLHAANQAFASAFPREAQTMRNSPVPIERLDRLHSDFIYAYFGGHAI